MLLYEYPPKNDKRTAQLLEFHACAERKKIRKNALKSLILSVIVAAVALFIPEIAVKIVVLLVAAVGLVSAYLVYFSSKQINSKNDWTKIYDDRIEHSQTAVASNRVTHFCINYEDIKSSRQNIIGELVLKLKEDNNVRVTVSDGKTVKEKAVRDNCVTLYFSNSKPKLYLINNLYEKIGYPKKDYVAIEDDDEDEY